MWFDQLPRRLVYVVNRRTVVDQATDVAQRIREKLSAVPQVHRVLATLSADPRKPARHLHAPRRASG